MITNETKVKVRSAVHTWNGITFIIILLALVLAFTQGGFGALFAAFITMMGGYVIGALGMLLLAVDK